MGGTGEGRPAHRVSGQIAAAFELEAERFRDRKYKLRISPTSNANYYNIIIIYNINYII